MAHDWMVSCSSSVCVHTRMRACVYHDHCTIMCTADEWPYLKMNAVLCEIF